MPNKRHSRSDVPKSRTSQWRRRADISNLARQLTVQQLQDATQLCSPKKPTLQGKNAVCVEHHDDTPEIPVPQPPPGASTISVNDNCDEHADPVPEPHATDNGKNAVCVEHHDDTPEIPVPQPPPGASTISVNDDCDEHADPVPEPHATVNDNLFVIDSPSSDEAMSGDGDDIINNVSGQSPSSLGDKTNSCADSDDNLDENSGAEEDVQDNSAQEEESDDECSGEEGDGGAVDEDDIRFDEPLFAGSKITVLDSLILLMSFILHFQLSWSCVKVLLTVIQAHMPQNNSLVKSTYFLRKFFSKGSRGFERHFFCTGCMSELDVGAVCAKAVCAGKEIATFILFSIEKQLKNLFERESFRRALMYRFNRVKKDGDAIEDIFDGELYQKFLEFLSNPYNFTLMFYSDGIRLFKSSKLNVWPLFFSVNELPFKLRFNPENIIIGGLWYAKVKPNFNTFVTPLRDFFVRLHAGITIPLQSLQGTVIKVRGILLCGTGDMPARSSMLNMNQFNGKYGCMKCLLKGLSVRLSATRRVWTYPFSRNLSLRTSAQSKIHARQATRLKRTVYGIKGATVFSSIVPNYISAMGVDLMHCLFSGVVRKLMELWFDRQHRNEEFSLYARLNEIEERLSKIKPPNFVSRPPRPIKTHSLIYKATELFNWFYYFSVPVLLGIMPDKFYSHYLLLVQACYLLNQNSVTLDDIQTADQLITKFVKLFQEYYGQRFMSANVHALRHLPLAVRQLGPLWVFSCFPQEGLNGKICKLVKGTNKPEIQICDSFVTLQKLPYLISKLPDDSLTKNIISLLKQSRGRVIERIDNSMFSIGTCYRLTINLPLMLATAFAKWNLGLNPTFYVFHKLLKGSLLYVAKGNLYHGKTISYLVLFKNEYVGAVECFVKVTNCLCKNNGICQCFANYFAIIRNVNLVNNNKLDDHVTFIGEIRMTDNFEAILIKDLDCICYMAQINDRIFCSKPVNDMETDL